MRSLGFLTAFSLFLFLALPSAGAPVSHKPTAADTGTHTVLAVRGTHFTLNGEPVFLLGLSYYGALGAPVDFVRQDLDDMRKFGFNWIRVWATWSAYGNDVTAFDGEGKAREPFFSRLRRILEECDKRGMVVDITLSRGNGVVGPPRLQSLRSHLRAVETLARRLKPFRNWYIDLANERNIRDKRFVSFAELKELRNAVKKIDPLRLVTASHAGDIPESDLEKYVRFVGVDFIAPHRPRNPRSPAGTENRTRRYLRRLRKLDRPVPVHYQEPFRRGFTRGWNPEADDYVTDARGAFKGGAAGWCLHNGSEKHKSDGVPRRSFDMREKRLFDQLDTVEKEAILRLSKCDFGLASRKSRKKR